MASLGDGLDALSAPAAPNLLAPPPPPKQTAAQRAAILNYPGVTPPGAGVETPQKTRPNPLRQILPAIDVPLAAYEAVARDAARRVPAFRGLPVQLQTMLGGIMGPTTLLIPGSNPATEKFVRDLRTGGPSAVSENDVYYRKGQLQSIINDPSSSAAQKAEAGFFMEHPYVAGALDFIQEFGNPGNVLAGEGVGALGRGLAHLSPAAADIGGAVAHVGKGFLSPVTAPLRAAAGLAGKAARASAGIIPGPVGNAVRTALDRYAALNQRGGTRYVTRALAMQAAPEHAEAVGVNQIRKLGDNLTRAQKKELQRLSYRDPETGERVAQRDPSVPEPKGETLEQRADEARRLITLWSQEQNLYGVRTIEGGELENNATFWPMSRFKNPVYGSEEEAAAPTFGTRADEPSTIGAGRWRGRYSSGVTKGGHRVNPPITDPEVFADLHPEYDPIYQLEAHFRPALRAIANEKQKRLLESFPYIDPATGKTVTDMPPGIDSRVLTARLPLYYGIDTKEGPMVFGEGAAGKKAYDKFVQRVARGRTRESVRSDPDMQAFAQKQGVAPESLGTRFVTSRKLSGPMERLREAKKVAPQVVKPAQGPLTRAAAAARRAGADISRSSAGLEEALGENLSAARKAKLEAHAARTSAPLYEKDAAVIEKLTTASTTPLQREIIAQAKEERDLANTAYNEVADYMRTRKVKPDWVWKDGRWQLAGEWADVPKKYLDVGNKPMEAPRSVGGVVSRVDGDVDEIASELGQVGTTSFKDGEALREWMANHPKPSRVSDHIEGATQTLVSQKNFANRAELENLIAESGSPVTTAKGAVKYLRGVARKMKKDAVRYEQESAARAGAERVIGPRARGAVASGERTGKRLNEVQETIAQTQAGLSAAASKRVVAAADALSDAKAIRATADEFKRRFRIEYPRIAERVKQDLDKQVAKKMVPTGYVKESDLSLASPTGRDMALDDSFAHFLKDQQPIKPGAGPLAEGADKFWTAMRVINRLARASIVLIPTVHGINNLGMAYLAEGGGPVTMAKILTGRYVPRAGVRELAFEHGASQDYSPSMWALDQGPHATTNIHERARMAAKRFETSPGAPAEPDRVVDITPEVQARADKMKAQFRAAYNRQVAESGGKVPYLEHEGPESGVTRASYTVHGKPATPPTLGPVGREVEGMATLGLLAEKQYNRMNQWLFQTVEQGYAFDLFDRFTRAGMAPGEAALRVRNALGRYDNLTAAERFANINRIFYFYPWMKTVIPFWTKKGILDPKWWTAPVAATRTNNELQGYDDPSRPFTATLGQSSPGVFRRANLPIPQRVLEPIAAAARIPADLVTGDISGAGADLRSPYNYLAGHLNPFFQVGTDTGQLAANRFDTTRVPPWNLFRTEPGEGRGSQALGTLRNLVNRFIAPAARLDTLTSDPVGMISAFIGGTFLYDTNGQRVKNAASAARRTVDAAFPSEPDLELMPDQSRADQIRQIKAGVMQRVLQNLQNPSPSPSVPVLGPAAPSAAPTSGGGATSLGAGL